MQFELFLSWWRRISIGRPAPWLYPRHASASFYVAPRCLPGSRLKLAFRLFHRGIYFDKRTLISSRILSFTTALSRCRNTWDPHLARRSDPQQGSHCDIRSMFCAEQGRKAARVAAEDTRAAGIRGRWPPVTKQGRVTTSPRTGTLALGDGGRRVYTPALRGAK